MVVAVSVVGMVQMSIHQVVHMVAVRNSFVTAAWAMDVVGIVSAALVVGCASRRVTV